MMKIKKKKKKKKKKAGRFVLFQTMHASEHLNNTFSYITI